jgi:phosphatidylethanolamine/phosphatidyl-N-methylethanolamine N-methyltransferase
MPDNQDAVGGHFGCEKRRFSSALTHQEANREPAEPMRFSPVRNRMKRSELGFFLLWLRRPTRVGAVVPSGKALAASMAAHIDVDTPGVVVELGGGTGSITEAILATGTAPRDLVVVEREAKLCAILAERFPHVRILQGDARDLKHLLKRAGIDAAKIVISSLPLLSMDTRDCQCIISGAFSVLPTEGKFLQFTYGPASPISRQTRERLGIAGRRSNWILNNLPPATIWQYHRDPSALNVRAA